MARKTFSRPSDNYDREYFNYLITEIEYQTGLNFSKGERIIVNGGDNTELVLISPNGTKYKISVDDSGNLTTTATTV